MATQYSFAEDVEGDEFDDVNDASFRIGA